MLLYTDLGFLDYLSALELQEQLVQRKQHQSLPDILLFVEHPHVYTLGRGGNEANVLAPEAGGRFEAEIVGVEEEADGPVVTLRPERGEAKRIPLAAVKEARLAFRF